jgi:benzoyl-CoA reductase/2-hydroxyglutaryl-CoA dehydratase subunit BcrC/BadD/HgdB
MESFEIMQRHYQERSMAAKEWKKSGGKVVGYISHAIPVEMIIAAGLFPFRMSGDPIRTTEVGDKTMEYFFDPMVRSQYDMLLTGQYDFLDLLVIPHCNDSVFKLYYYLLEAKRIEPSLNLPDVYLFDMLYTRWLSTGLYNRDRVRNFKEKLEELSGKELSNGSLASAISIVNENRMLLKRISDLRKEFRPRISGVEALQIIGSSMFMSKEEHNKLLKGFLCKADQLAPKNGVRVSIEGSPIDNLQFYELVESCGATIVTERHTWGDRYSDSPVDASIEPLEAIVEKYHLRSPSPRVYPSSEEADDCLKIAEDSKVQGVIFFFLEWDDMPAWQYPEQKKVLEDNCIPTLCLRMQKYHLSDTQELKSTIESFIKEIRN